MGFGGPKKPPWLREAVDVINWELRGVLPGVRMDANKLCGVVWTSDCQRCDAPGPLEPPKPQNNQNTIKIKMIADRLKIFWK
eukprot:5658563-Amphidinium_carterae.1